jgi:hypothetical protein
MERKAQIRKLATIVHILSAALPAPGELFEERSEVATAERGGHCKLGF